MTYEIALIPGDGIGPEVVDRSLPVVEAAADAHGVSLETTRYDWGSDRYLAEGAMMPDDGLDRLRGYDAIFLGAVGHPEVPDHVTLRGLRLEITKGFKQHVCKRPSYLFEGVTGPLRDYGAGEIDFVVYRQNTEGEYADIGGREYRGHDNEVAFQGAMFTREGTETIVRAAFEAASEREGKLTNVTKSNAQAYGMVFWDDVLREIAGEYPDVEVERLLVDAASMDFVRRPDEFDVLVASNLFGDILTDLGAGISGSMGLAPSSNIDPTQTHPSMFEPVHGSAFDITGEGVANPIGTVLSWELLWAHLGEDALARELRAAVRAQLADPDAPRTPDIGGESGSEAVANDLRTRLG
ncbi:isocitrate/isopropylmalate dehydrogenase family protein [Halalkalicoccus jeotgali]|uniref:3-isopropylmalate dehydrogenase n=1 Tax=Halalkalicoccus jeotgali (strain DSM 18796 / CECT 7217 / JCM 14584 / KCTC 4019 / B3) TaxID=795797 RepID=D8J7G0_HALJB|nr:isocitrate/isopropylmalate family dehydrogenase [Halalkalicoccus jeotgali]ADJ14055.1 3-isopropylmalate dehydrogenase [Halalkalicoccus jeotgali B3]ELY33901.1 3-isopropylmalate dehydrogenase [Halalkalicoccus jeotgali B3]